MAVIEKRGPYQWRVRIRRRGHPEQTRTFATKAEAEDWAKVIESEMVRGIFWDRSKAESTLLRELLDRYAAEVLPTKRSQSTVRSQIKGIATELGGYSVAALNPPLLAQWRDRRLGDVDGQTVRKDLSLLRRVLNHAAKEWGIPLPRGNPLQQVSVPKQPPGRDRRLQPGEEELLMAAAREYGGMIGPIIVLALETGMRRGELAALRWDEIDLGRRVAHLPLTKNGASRDVPLSSRAVATLQEIPRRPGADGIWGRMRADSITQAFDRVSRRAGIEGLRYHDLRHEATSRFFEKGLNPMQVASITGHKDLGMLRRYTHLRAEDLATLLG